MSFWTRRECARRVIIVLIHFERMQNERTLFGSLKNTVRLDKTWQLHQRIRMRHKTLYEQNKYVITCMQYDACLYLYNLYTILYKPVSLSVCLSCRAVDAKLSILFSDDKIENAKNVASTLLKTHV